MKMFDQQQLNDLSQRVSEVLGDRLLELSPPQEGILDKALGRVLMHNNGQADQVTPEEIEGAWEMIEEIWGQAFNEEYLSLKQ